MKLLVKIMGHFVTVENELILEQTLKNKIKTWGMVYVTTLREQFYWPPVCNHFRKKDQH